MADTEAEVAEKYGVVGKFRDMTIAKRESFLVDPSDKIVKHYKKVNPDTHSEEVLADIKTLQAASE